MCNNTVIDHTDLTEVVAMYHMIGRWLTLHLLRDADCLIFFCIFPEDPFLAANIPTAVIRGGFFSDS